MVRLCPCLGVSANTAGVFPLGMVRWCLLVWVFRSFSGRFSSGDDRLYPCLGVSVDLVSIFIPGMVRSRPLFFLLCKRFSSGRLLSGKGPLVSPG